MIFKQMEVKIYNDSVKVGVRPPPPCLATTLVPWQVTGLQEKLLWWRWVISDFNLLLNQRIWSVIFCYNLQA